MKIVVIDGYTLNPGDLSWEEIKKSGSVLVFDRTLDEELISRCEKANIVITNKVVFDANIISQLPDLKLIAVSATGHNCVDSKYAREKGIVVCNIPDYGTDAVAEHTFALLFELNNKVGLHNLSVHMGDWVNSIDFCYRKSSLSELKGKTLGIIGFGRIGKRTAEIAKVFGMKIIYFNPKKVETDLAEYSELENLFITSDFVSLHCPLKPDNHLFVNKYYLEKMKKSAFLINTSRGQLINEADLSEVLNNDKIAGAALDVLSSEPPKNENPLLSAKNCVITPHLAWQSLEARQRIINTLNKNIVSFLKGNPVNVVN